MLYAAAIFACLTGMQAAADELAAGAEDAPEFRSLSNLNGSWRGSYWDVANNTLGRNQFGLAELWLKAAPHLGESATLKLEGWTRNSGERPAARTQSLAREAYVDFSSGAADFRIGKQIIAWGKADQLNPTDNLSPRDNSLFVAESDDQRFGTVAAKGSYNFAGALSGLVATAVWLPRFRPNIQPIVPPIGVTVIESMPGGDQYAFKLEQSGQAADWSISYFHGYDLNPDLAIQPLTPQYLLLQHHRIRVLGVDAATVLGRYGVRAEAAYTQTEDAAGTDPFIKNPFLYVVLGADRTFFEYLNINVQYFARRVSAYSDPSLIVNPMIQNVAMQQNLISNQQDGFQQGLSLRIANKWLHETLEAELAAVYHSDHKDYLLRPKIGYAFDDHWKGTLGAILFRGEAQTFFGMMRERSSVYLELRYSF